MKKMLRSKKGFSLVELLIVLTIIAVIAALAINVFGNVSEKSKIKADVAQAENIKKAIVSYINETEDVNMAYFTTGDMQDLINKLAAPQAGDDIAAVTGNQSITGADKKFGPYLTLKQDNGSYVLPNPKQAGGKYRFDVTYYQDTQNAIVTVDTGTDVTDPTVLGDFEIVAVTP
jgi:prepilin-type N-terminal cleavage/methylation domain-containing protein